MVNRVAQWCRKAKEEADRKDREDKVRKVEEARAKRKLEEAKRKVGLFASVWHCLMKETQAREAGQSCNCEEPIMDRYNHIEPKRTWHSFCMIYYSKPSWPVYVVSMRSKQKSSRLKLFLTSSLAQLFGM